MTNIVRNLNNKVQWQQRLFNRGWFKAVETVCKRVWLEEFGNNKVALLIRGSSVKGNMTPTSDVDLLMIVEKGEIGKREFRHSEVPFHLRWMPIEWIETGIRASQLRQLDLIINSEAVYEKDSRYNDLRSLANIKIHEVINELEAEAVHQLSDAKGQLEVENLQCSLYLLRMSIHFKLQSILIKSGYMTFKHKDVYIDGNNDGRISKIRKKLFDFAELSKIESSRIKALISEYEMYVKK